MPAQGAATTELAYRTALDLAGMLSSSRISSRELLDYYVRRVDELNPRINAVVATSLQQSTARARAADEATARGESWGPLHGLPVTIKDSFEVVGMPTTSGAVSMAGHMPEQNAASIERLVAAGAIVYGKTNLPEWADDLQTYNDLYGTTGNPWDPDRVPGGSSGGSAAALAAGFTPLEMGSDIGGSIRNPAHFCGVYGHKPSYATVSLLGHIPGPPGMRSRADIAVAGPLARDVADLRAALEIVAGPDPWDAVGWHLEYPEPKPRALEDFKVGVWLDSDICPPDAEVRTVLEAAVDAIEAGGAKVDRTAHPEIDQSAGYQLYLQLMYGQQASGFSGAIRRRADTEYDGLDTADDSRAASLTRGIAQRHRHWLAVNERRHRLRERWSAWFEDYDVLLCPVMSTTAFPHDHSHVSNRTIDIDGTAYDYWSQLFWAGITGVVFLPSTVIPAGLGTSGRPVGMQVVGPYLGDRACLHFAQVAEAVLGGFRIPPGWS